MAHLILTKEEIDFLENYVNGRYNAMVAPIGEQNIEIQLLDKASQYEQENDLIDERIAFSEDCDLLKWFYHKYKTQS